MKSYFFLAILFCLYSGVTMAQDKYLASDYGYTNNIRQVNEVMYEYDAKAKKYIITKQKSLSFDNGKLKVLTEADNVLAYSQTTTRYKYDPKGLPVSVVKEGNLTGKDSFNFVYKNGRLIAKKGSASVMPHEETYEYNTHGQLAKITTRKTTGGVRISTYSGYKEKNTYTLTENDYLDNILTNTIISEYVNGQLVSLSRKFAFSDKPVIYTYKYDESGHKIEEQSGNTVYRNVYRYDDRKNPFQIKWGGKEGPDKITTTPNSFQFAKITYNDGLVLGTTDLSAFFVEQYDKQSSSYGFDKKMDTSMNAMEGMFDDEEEDIEYAVLKTTDGKFKVKADGEYITLSVKALKAPNDLDLVLFDTTMEITMFAKGFYSTATIANEWITPLLLPYSKNNAYFVMSKGGTSVSVIVAGRYLNLKEYELIKSASGKDLFVRKAGRDIYILKDCYGKPDHLFYPADIQTISK